MAKQFQVCFPGGQHFDVAVGDTETVLQLREVVEQRRGELPPATFLKLMQGGRVLLDQLSVAELKQEEPVVAVVTRETRLDVLLHASGHCGLYADQLSRAEKLGDSSSVVGPLPTILTVLEEMSGEAKSVEMLQPGAQEGWLEFYGDTGALLLPSLEAAPLLGAMGSAGPLSAVTLSVSVNSDSYDNGLGVVVEASPLACLPAECPLEFTFNGCGLQNEGRRRNAVKFHPGMRGAQLRVEGGGGFPNQDVGFTPKSFAAARASDTKLHSIVLRLGVDGSNLVRLQGPDASRPPNAGTLGEWQKEWKNALFDGLHIPALYAWLDLPSPSQPLHIGPITLQGHLASSEMPCDDVVS